MGSPTPLPASTTRHSYQRIANTALAAADKIFARDRVLARPLRVHLEVNDFCNLRCPHCPRENPASRKNTGNLPLEAVRRLAPLFEVANYVGLAGNGEPFLHPEFRDILEIVTGAGATPSIICNGTLWKRRGFIDVLPRLGPMIIMVSFDGGTKETFERWRRPAIFEDVIDNLAALKAAKARHGSVHPIVNFLCCLMKDNMGETERIVEIAAEHGVSVVVFQNMYPYVEAVADQRIENLQDSIDAVTRARERGARCGVRVEHLPLAFDFDERKRIERERRAAAQPSAFSNGTAAPNGFSQAAANGASGAVYHCNNVWEQVHVTVDASVKFCCWWKGPAIGNVLTDDVEELWNSPEWRAVRADLTRGVKHDSCLGCHNLVAHDRGLLWKAGKREMKDLLNR
ncbi:MAG: radical SAM/SPASM domain-containing protein [Candidatus Sumerlaeia bacterium]|nr:radical SAM/SPASM domain-containing protein [Candidatus Sumerlaeia bacterium]